MKLAALCILLLTACVASRAENLRFKQFGRPIPALPNLEVRWNAPLNALPPKIWVYHLLPRPLSPQILSNLLELGSFTEKDKTGKGDPLEFKSLDGTRRLFLSYPLGRIYYEESVKHSPSNLVEGLPSESESINLTKKLLPKLGVNLADIDGDGNGSEPVFHVGDSVTTYFVKPQFITNIESRRVGFRRVVDGGSFVGGDTGGDGDITFGDHGRIIKIELSWRNMERDKSYATLPLDMMINSLRAGKAVQGYLPMNSSGIRWPNVKTVTVNEARLGYYAGDITQRSDWLEPFAVLDTVVDTGRGNIRVEIDCPIIDETASSK